MGCEYQILEGLCIQVDRTHNLDHLHAQAWALRPWRKGPFYLQQGAQGFCIESEWQSFMKWDLIKDSVSLSGLDVADVGCNNGYYLFCMDKQKPKSLVGFDPSTLYKAQFDYINALLQCPIVYENLGIEDLRTYARRFDVIFCLGVLYHRKDPLSALKALHMGLKKGGVLILDTLLYDSPLEVALCPKSYAKMSNVYFIPSIKALQNWAERAGFADLRLLTTKTTTTQEQRRTPWITGLSLGDFLDPSDPSRSIEGYAAPCRGYFILHK
ncbi:tRNA 5-methoxyuridine(34)/uridine 5-oxyacetic acid(34) synthase CmoB [Helicobacter bizzozeronii]|uniref:tRNA (5-methoxyuridine) 34 synthase n=1 Tax=Helicobacter bizzozeronii (strain CIII-1) TaxID=1002804 RepID=F8KP86_HELBC|nr:tRNA 5-methoxyuridine(34)/uridine 5-oxyacetic acid(34) synthase CmoB [Helicobacter bizzozeronii]CCB80594.1 tRNA (5-methoxyuridine) 34 synthase [Helicobacter bizzozeronii CIII-1]